MPQTFTAQGSAAADATGRAEVNLQPRGNVDYVITLQNVASSSVLLQPAYVAYVDGLQRDTTDTGSSDTSDTRIVLRAGSNYKGVWTGADVGALCTVTLNGIQYDYGTAPAE